jgi:hypothetical protein
MAIILQEALRGFFYEPFYVALAKNAFAGEGLDIRFTSSPQPDETALRVMDGTVDVSWGWTDARDEDLPEGPGVRSRLFRRGGDARSLPADGPRAQAGLHAGRP